MLTIVEGPDGAGKTTLIETWQTKSVHHGAYIGEKSVAHHYMTSLRWAHSGFTKIFDRSWLAEPIYGNAFRDGQDRLGIGRARMLERCALSLNAIVIKCLPPFEVCRDNWAKRKNIEYLTNEDALYKVWMSYKVLGTNDAYKTSLPIIPYDYTQETPIKLSGVNVDDLRTPKNEGPDVGRWAPGEVSLLVGDQVNAKDQRRGRIQWRPPFVSYNEGGSSIWLANGLDAVGISESELYWVNSTNDATGFPIKADFVNKLRPKKIVALGKAAERWCIENSLVFTSVPHPQFWKRYHPNERYELFDVLSKVKEKS